MLNHLSFSLGYQLIPVRVPRACPIVVYGVGYAYILGLLTWFVCVYNGNVMVFFSSDGYIRHVPMDSLPSSEVLIRGMVSIVYMITVSPGLYIVSYNIDVSEVLSISNLHLFLISTQRRLHCETCYRLFRRG